MTIAFFYRNDLELDYVWSSAHNNNNAAIFGDPYYTSLNRHDGFEVLDFINGFGQQYNSCDKHTGKKVERMVHSAPPDICSPHGLRQWILRNWYHY